MHASARTIWDFWADRYEGLWAQHFSLAPSRKLVLQRFDEVVPSDARVLDLGCGVGQFVKELAERRPDCRIVGIDPSADMVARAKRDYAADNATYLHGYLWDVPRGDGFDVVTSMHAFPYMPDKYGALVRIRELLRPGGRVLVIQANTEGAYDWAFLKFVKLTTTKADYLSASQLLELMHSAGFQPGVVRPIPAPPFIPSIQLVEGVL